MALAQLTRVIKGFQIWDKDGTDTIIDIFLASANPNTSITATKGSLAVDTTNGALYINTDGTTAWSAFSSGGGSAIEEGYIRAFIGKNGTGSETPDYDTATGGTVNWIGNNDNLELAIGKLDQKLGATFTAATRTKGQLTPATDSIMAMLDLIDQTIGPDADMTSTNYIALANTIYANLSGLDAQVKINSDAITMGQNWREHVLGATADAGLNAAIDGTILTTLLPFSDDDDNTLPIGAFSDGDYLLSKNTAGLDKLFLVYDDAGTLKVTTVGVDPLAVGDTFITKYYLPDPSGGENSAIIWYDGTDLIKIADVDWQLATGINLSSGYSAAVAAAYPAANDTVEVAISKLHKDILDLVSLTGVALGATDLGTFTGEIIADNRTIKQALQDLETAVHIGGVKKSAAAVGAVDVVLDSVPVADADVVHWVVMVEGVTDSTSRYSATVRALNDGDTIVLDVDESPFLRSTPPIDIDISVDISGGAMRLLVNSDTAGGADVKAVRWIAL